MRTITKGVLPLAAIAMAGAPLLLGAGPASAAGTGTTLSAHLTPLNGSGAHSTAWATLDGDQLHITLKSTGLLAGMPHAQHIHIGGSHTCPDPGMKGTGTGGHITTSDAAGNYGAIAVSLTTTGDTSPKSGLAVTRFPVGSATYERTITVSPQVAAQIRDGEGVIVQHGVDYNGNGKYDGSAKSDLDPALPEEATDPAACGTLDVAQMASMPTGGVQTGNGSTAGIEGKGLIGLGVVAFGAGAAGLVLLRRRIAEDRS